jgi:hypothetical protein
MFAMVFTTLVDLRLVCLVSVCVLSPVVIDVRDMLSVRGDQLLIWVELGSHTQEIVIASLIHVGLSRDGLDGTPRFIRACSCWTFSCWLQ